MYYKNIIEKKLIELEGGKFQRMCNDILEHLGYGMVTNSGGQDGTDKTIKGTPDAYILLENGKFTFIEYTTQQTKVCSKFEADINKCLDESKTKVPINQIEKIVLMYNSSLSVGEINSLTVMCKKKDVVLEMFDINNITHLFSSKLPFLAKDHLGIEIDKGQFLDYKSFIESNDKSLFSTPLGMGIFGRDDDIDKIHDLMNSSDFVVVSGKTGVGKTKLVIEALADRYNEDKNINVWFIKDRGLGLYEELLRYTAIGNHVIFIDDINKQTSLNEMMIYIAENRNSIKVIATVRDYALKSSVQVISKYITPEVHKLEKLEDDVIIELLKSNYNIQNQDYHRLILRLAKGNVRLAVMMAIIAVKENTLESINNVSKILEKYYQFMGDKLEELEDEDSLKALGALAFIDKLHLESDESMKIISSITGIFTEKLKKIYKSLHYDEIVDIYEDEVVVLPDQIISVFIFHYVYEVRKLLKYEDIIEQVFPVHKKRIVQNVNSVVAYYDNINYFKDSIKALWSKWESNEDERLEDLILTFWFVKPEETLIYIDEMIENLRMKNNIVEDYTDFKNIEYNQMLSTLGQYAINDNNISALNLTICYLLKDYSKIKDVSKMLIDHFGYSIYSYKQGYQVQKILIDVIIENMGKSEVMIQLFSNISTHLLAYFTEWTEFNNNKSFVIHMINLFNYGEMKVLREHIWKKCDELIQEGEYAHYVFELLRRFGDSSRDSEDLSLYEYDFEMICGHIYPYMDFMNLANCAAFYKTDKRYRRLIDKSFLDVDTTACKIYSKYKLFKDKAYDYSKNYEEGKAKCQETHVEFASKLNENTYDEFMRFCVELNVLDDDNYNNGEVLETIILNSKSFVNILKCYLMNNTPFKLQPLNLINQLIGKVGYHSAFELISFYEFDMKEYWQFILYSVVKKEDVTFELYQGLIDYFEKEEEVSIGYHRKLDFLVEYTDFDESIYISVIEIIKGKLNDFLKKMYFFNLFSNEESTDQLIRTFEGKRSLLEEVYLYVFENNEIHDTDGKICRKFLSNNPLLLQRIIDIVCSQKANQNQSFKGFFDYSIFWEQDDDKLFELFENLMNLSERYSVDSKVEELLFDSRTENFGEKKKLVIFKYIHKYSKEADKMSRLFYTLANYDNETRVSFYTEFTKVNEDVEAFKELPFNKSCESWSGSEIPRIIRKKEFTQELIDVYNGPKFLRHKSFLKDRLDGYDEYIKSTRVRELLRDY